MKQYWNKSHIRQLFIMLHHRSSDGSHQISTEKAEIGLRIFRLEGRHQMGRMQVSGSFTDNQIVLHGNFELGVLIFEISTMRMSEFQLLTIAIQFIYKAVSSHIDCRWRDSHISVFQRPMIIVLIFKFMIGE